MKANINALAAVDMEKFLRAAKVRVEELDAAKSHRAKAIRIGQFLSPLVGREVSIEVKGRVGVAVLRAAEGRGREKKYFAEVRWNAEPSKESKSGPTAGKEVAIATQTSGPSVTKATTSSAVAKGNKTQACEPAGSAAKNPKPKLTTTSRVSKVLSSQRPTAGGNEEQW